MPRPLVALLLVRFPLQREMMLLLSALWLLRLLPLLGVLEAMLQWLQVLLLVLLREH
jgi:hypothetical protein